MFVLPTIHYAPHIKKSQLQRQTKSFLVVLRGSSFSLWRGGQSLIEILVGVGVGALLIIAAVSVIAPVLNINTQANRAQAGAALSRELLDNLSVWAEGDWHNIAGLSTSSAYHYYLNTATSPFSSSSGDESLVVSTTTYKRFFYVDDVYRDDSGNIAAPPPWNYDPSTKRITVGCSWLGAATDTISIYLTRSSNRVFIQTDWSGGPNQAGPITSTNERFASSTTNIIYSASSSIRLNL